MTLCPICEKELSCPQNDFQDPHFDPDQENLNGDLHFCENCQFSFSKEFEDRSKWKSWGWGKKSKILLWSQNTNSKEEMLEMLKRIEKLGAFE